MRGEAYLILWPATPTNNRLYLYKSHHYCTPIYPSALKGCDVSFKLICPFFFQVVVGMGRKLFSLPHHHPYSKAKQLVKSWLYGRWWKETFSRLLCLLMAFGFGCFIYYFKGRTSGWTFIQRLNLNMLQTSFKFYNRITTWPEASHPIWSKSPFEKHENGDRMMRSWNRKVDRKVGSTFLTCLHFTIYNMANASRN